MKHDAAIDLRIVVLFMYGMIILIQVLQVSVKQLSLDLQDGEIDIQHLQARDCFAVHLSRVYLLAALGLLHKEKFYQLEIVWLLLK